LSFRLGKCSQSGHARAVRAVEEPRHENGDGTAVARTPPDGKIDHRCASPTWRLKVRAVRRRCRVNDVILESIENHLALSGQRAAA
jgi:hypothetical protein